jgi:molybdopterin synthase catalytic subunit
VVRLQREPIRIEELIDEVRGDGDGAVALFVGTVRDHNLGRRVSHLEYHAYEEMAVAELERVETAVLGRHDVSGAAIVHRLGRLEVGEASVVVVVGAAHRAPAFDACRDLIDSLKRSVPIWKKEFFDSGEAWID